MLHLDFNRVLRGVAFTATSRIDYSVTAVLVDGRGHVLRVERGYPYFTHSESSPPADLSSGAVHVPALDEGPEALRSFSHQPLDSHLAVLATAAIAELDRRLKELDVEGG